MPRDNRDLKRYVVKQEREVEVLAWDPQHAERLAKRVFYENAQHSVHETNVQIREIPHAGQS